MATTVNYKIYFGGRNGRDDSDTIRAVQNSIRTDYTFLCYYEDGTEYTFQTGDTAAGKFTDKATGLEYTITGTVTPTADTNEMVWERSLADVALPADFDLAFIVTSSGAENDISFNALYVIEETPGGGGSPSEPSLINLIKAWAESGAFQTPSVVYYGATGTIDTGTTVLWPDGATGTVTVIARSVIANSLGLIDSSSITHSTSGLTVTQPAYTRDANGQIITQPALVVA